MEKDQQEMLEKSELRRIARETSPKPNIVKPKNEKSYDENFAVYGFMRNRMLEVDPTSRAIVYSHKRHKPLAQNLSDKYNLVTSYSDWGIMSKEEKKYQEEKEQSIWENLPEA